MQKGKSKEQVIVLNGVPLNGKWAKSEQIYLVTSHTVTILPYHITITPLKPINYLSGINVQPNTLLKMEKKLSSIWRTKHYSCTNTTEIRAEHTCQFSGCNVESGWSYHSFKEKHYQQLHKSVRLYRKNPRLTNKDIGKTKHLFISIFRI